MATGKHKMSPAKRLGIILACLLAIVAIFAILSNLRLPSHTMFWREIHNTGHTPLFGAMALAVLGILLALKHPADNARLWYYLSAAAITVGLGAVVEVSQIAGPGDADIIDLLRDIAGVVAALLIATFFDRRLSIRGPRRWAVLMAALAILMAAFAPIGLLAKAYVQRRNAFPVLLDFDSASMRFARLQDARLERVAAPPAWGEGRGMVGKVSLRPGQFPGLSIAEAEPDWRGYGSFRFDIYSELAEPVQLWLRVDDLHHNNDYGDRFNDVITVEPGANTYTVPLERVRRAPAKRVMNMREVRSVMVFANNVREQFVLYFDNFRLEPPRGAIN